MDLWGEGGVGAGGKQLILRDLIKRKNLPVNYIWFHSETFELIVIIRMAIFSYLHNVK